MTQNEITAIYIRVLDGMVEKGLVKHYKRTATGNDCHTFDVTWTDHGFPAAAALKQVVLAYALGYQGGNALAFTNAVPGDEYLVGGSQIPIEPKLHGFWKTWATYLDISHDAEALGIFGQIVGESGPDSVRRNNN